MFVLSFSSHMRRSVVLLLSLPSGFFGASFAHWIRTAPAGGLSNPAVKADVDDYF